MPSQIYGLRLLRDPGRLGVALGLMAVIFVVWRALQLAYLTSQPQWGYDLSFYWIAAQRLLDGDPIYSAAQLAGPYAPQGQDGFLYPPPFAALAIPLVWLAPGGATDAEWLWSAAGLVVLVVVTLVLLRSERLDERYPVLRGSGRWLLVAATVTFAPVIGELSIGNVHLLLLGLFTLAWIGLRRGDRTGDWLAGIGLGVAAVIKVFPGVLLLWLLLTRRYRAAGAMVAAAAVLALVTLPITGLQPWLQYPTVLANLSAVYDTTDTISPTIWLAPYIGFDVARIGVTLAGLALLGYAAMSIDSARRQTTAADSTVLTDSTARSFAVALTLSVLIAPNVFHHYLTIFVLPMLIALAAGLPLRWIAIAYLLMSGGQQPALGDMAWIVNRVLPTAGSLVLLGALLLARPRGAATPLPVAPSAATT